MKKLYIKDKNNRNFYYKTEKFRIILLYLLRNLKINKNSRNKIFMEFNNLTLNNSITKIKNRCILSNRSKSIYRGFKLSRIFLKQYGHQGFICGLKKAVW